MSQSQPDESAFDLEQITSTTFVKEVICHETIDSTNNFALELCRSNQVSGSLLILTEEQTAGRGRGENVWWSTEGSLAFSLVIDADEFRLPQELWPQASLTTGLAVCLALEQLLGEGHVALKWPNDVHLQGRKIGGILVEVGPRPSGKLVLGIGLNVNNSLAEAASELQARATSLFDFTGRDFMRTDVLTAILAQLEQQLSRLALRDPLLANDWQSRCALRGKTVEIDSGKKRVQGTCQGIDVDGALVVVTDEGPQRIFGGTVTHID